MIAALFLFTAAAAFLAPFVYKVIREVILFYRRRKQLSLLDGPPQTLLTGSLHLVPNNEDGRFLDFFRSLPVKYPKCCPLNLGPHRTQVFVYHPETVKAILTSSEPKHHSYMGPYRLFQPWLGNGILTGSGQRWFRSRRLITPAFHFDILKSYIDVYNSCSDVLIEKWMMRLEESPQFDIFNDVSLCTLNVIRTCAFSCDDDVQLVGDSHPYVHAVVELAKIQQVRLFNPHMLIDWLFKYSKHGRNYVKLCEYVHGVADDLIKKRREGLKELGADEDLGKQCKDFLDILLLARDEDGVGMTDLDIRAEVDTFLFAGHDTTASAITWILYSLAKHPEYQEKARAEVDSLGGCDISWEDLNRIPYLTMCIKEGLRCHNPVPNVSRELTKPMTLDGVELLPGTAVNIHIDCLHHNPHVWGEDHLECKPDRFLHENISKMDSYTFCPFSAGSRNCIGQNFAMNEVKVIVAKILQKFELSLSAECPDVVPVPLIVMRSLTGVHIKFTPRT